MRKTNRMKKRTTLLLILLLAAAQLALQALPIALPLRLQGADAAQSVSYYDPLASQNLFLPIVVVALSWLAHALLTLFLLTKRTALLQVAVISAGVNVAFNLVLVTMLLQNLPVVPLLVALLQCAEIWAMNCLHVKMQSGA